MIKTFCDCCGDEITQLNEMPNGEALGVLSRERRIGSKAPVQGNSFTLNRGKGDYCKYCVLAEINRILDDRPKASQEYEVPMARR